MGQHKGITRRSQSRIVYRNWVDLNVSGNHALFQIDWAIGTILARSSMMGHDRASRDNDITQTRLDDISPSGICVQRDDHKFVS